MNNSDDYIQEVELSIEQAKTIVQFGEALERLLRNKDFQLVIDQGYMTEEVRRLTLLLGDPNATPAMKDSIMGSLKAVGEFHGYIQARRAQCEQIRKDLEDAEQELSTLGEEEINV